MYNLGLEDSKRVREAMKLTKNTHVYKRLEAIALRGEGRSNDEIAEITRYHPKRVSKLVSIYCNEGLEALAQDRRSGGNHKNMTFEEEAAFLEPFRRKALAGKPASIAEIRAAYDERLGKKSATSTIYLVVSRHRSGDQKNPEKGKAKRPGKPENK